jgi:2-succinyl-6-hydroxy-2,4-cyclohexadiene-1-carboxylate synthase
MMAAMRETLVLLHGFAGTGRAWEPLVASLDAERYTALAPDLRGHGAAATLRPVSFEAVVGDVLALAPERFALCGYSMGGRIALQVALAAPERVKRLVLVSTTAGIEDEEARARRRAADERLAGELERDGLGTFSERWLTGPLFAADPPAAQALARADIARNDAGGLAAALRGIGTGAMEPLWDRLGELAMPARVVVGEHDAKFRTLGQRLASALPGAQPAVIPGAGHALPRVAPRALAAALSA